MRNKPLIIVRISKSDRDTLWNTIFRRYPFQEWGTFLTLGWRETDQGLVLTVRSIEQPVDGDLSLESDIVEIQSQYTRRMLRLSETHPFGIGIVHSHPEDYYTSPSASDYDMESYFADLLKGYTHSRPFTSLIFSQSHGKFSGTGRVWWKNQWHQVSQFMIEGDAVTIENFKPITRLSKKQISRVARLASVFSLEAAEALAGKTIGIVGLSGTGSPLVEILARAGVGKLILIDPEIFQDSNIERIHGSYDSDIDLNIEKCLIAKRHVLKINPQCEVIAIKGRIPQKVALDQLIFCDLVFGCTDLHSSRVSLTDISLRYLVPIIDMGVLMEGKDGNITGQVIQINRIYPDDPCMYCRGIIDSQIVSQELMPEDEQLSRREEARKAKGEGREPNVYWKELPQLNTVGYLTTFAASLAAGFGIGYCTTRFSMPKNRLEIALSPKGTQIVERDEKSASLCTCSSLKGIADQIPSAIISTIPIHWPQEEILDT